MKEVVSNIQVRIDNFQTQDLGPSFLVQINKKIKAINSEAQAYIGLFYLNLIKYNFTITEVKFIGHIVDRGRVHMDQKKYNLLLKYKFGCTNIVVDTLSCWRATYEVVAFLISTRDLLNDI
ncbi:unnamed protein product [Spirodela intermedia]|uniref:Uncharacterized protein n=1 Tax=Spirodela intermedia TaxID=51605 RepID=A0A7I8K7N4_SPIIN|nr:unnamed protein product [Spirodela intermedia]